MRGVLHSVCVDCISKIVPIACIEHGTHFIRVNAINSEIRILVIMARMQYYWNDSIGGASVDICDYGLSLPSYSITVIRGNAKHTASLGVTKPPNCIVHITSSHCKIMTLFSISIGGNTFRYNCVSIQFTIHYIMKNTQSQTDFSSQFISLFQLSFSPL